MLFADRIDPDTSLMGTTHLLGWQSMAIDCALTMVKQGQATTRAYGYGWDVGSAA